ncbi:DNA-processing protein DprA [Desulfoluna butyratoxydans]|uniref:Dna recombination-mediator protein a n=1 Tax=Desulfoluna butyratoxydans TaxID=231438 RepID=A0A4U8YPA3_9BACT|nr:DNA-processing protein DprA [Desulfoluna butyratoxydans]VFQ45267.1 dna recombination-mediator protein a [Desulfoluna butyratoxydans]
MNLLPWFALKEVPGVGNLLFKRLIQAFGSPEKVFESDAKSLVRVDGISHRLAETIRTHRLSDRARRSHDRARDAGVTLLPLTHGDYPRLLATIHDPPPLLQVSGHLDPESAMVALVGSRKATSYGLKNASDLAGELAGSGFTVVSGLARGIDTAAHKGALAAQGHTVAVLGCGLGRVYPPENRRLADAIACSGALISEFDYDSPPEAHHFPMRNRIISGLSLGTVVVEASLKSGSLITARCAADQNREVFAVPGHIRASQSTGTHHLIREGAKLVASSADITEEFAAHIHAAEKSTPTPRDLCDSASGQNPKKPDLSKFSLDHEEISVLKVLDLYPSHIDDILQNVPMGAGRLSAVLLSLELKGVVVRSPGKLFSLKEEKS